MPVPTVVGGTLKLLTMPPMETGSDATLNDMIAWPSAIAIIGIHDSRTAAALVAGAAGVLIDCLPCRWFTATYHSASGLEAKIQTKTRKIIQPASTRTGPCPSFGTGTWRRAAP